jgi:hypothetical protein
VTSSPARPQLRAAELEDSTPLLGDPAALRERMREHSHLFFRGLLDPARVDTVRGDLLDRIAPLGWLDLTRPRVYTDPEWKEGYHAIQRSERFHALAHEPALTGVAESLLDDSVVVLPMKIARVTYPGLEHPTPPHQDQFFVRGTADTITMWVPLGDCPRELGGLCVVPGSHRTGMRGVSAADGQGGIASDWDAGDAEYRTTDYGAGDVLMFHSHTLHWAPSNSADRLRLSADYRYQARSDPLFVYTLLPHEHLSGTPAWPELSRGWESTRWIDVGGPIRIVPLGGDALHPGASRFG